MTWATIAYDGGTIINKLNEWLVDAKPVTNMIDVWVVTDKRCTFYDGAAGGGTTVSKCILIHPNAKVSLATSAVKVAQQHQLTVTFTIDDALAYEKVFVMDPHAAFFPADVTQMVNNAITLVPIPGNTSTLVKQNLEAALSGD